MSHPPHLPAKSCSVPLYKRLRTVESVMFISVMAFFSGLVGGIVSDVYITPEQNAYTSVLREPRSVVRTAAQVPDALFVREQYRRTLSLVPKKAYAQTTHVSSDTIVHAVLLTDTGWFVAPQLQAGINARNWVALASDGEVYEIASLVFDTEHNLVYGSLESEGFRVVTFPFLDALQTGNGLWIAQHGTLEKTTLSYPEKNTALGSIHNPGDASHVFKTMDPAEPGSVLWTEDGTFFGFVDNEGAITPWFVVQSVYTHVFASESIEHKTLPISGYTVLLTEDENALAGGRYGFYVTHVDSSASTLVPGDVVVSLFGNPVVPWLLDAQVAMQAGADATVRTLSGDTLTEKNIQYR